MFCQVSVTGLTPLANMIPQWNSRHESHDHVKLGTRRPT